VWNPNDPPFTATVTQNYDIAPDGTRTATRLQIPIVTAAQFGFLPYFDSATFPYYHYPVTPSTTYTMSWWVKFLTSSLDNRMTMQFQEYDVNDTYVNGQTAFAHDGFATGTWNRCSGTFASSPTSYYAFFNFYTGWSPPSATDMLVWGAKVEASPTASGQPNVYLTNPYCTNVAYLTYDGFVHGPTL
jgi:hypothetical protein